MKNFIILMLTLCIASTAAFAGAFFSAGFFTAAGFFGAAAFFVVVFFAVVRVVFAAFAAGFSSAFAGASPRRIKY